MQMLRSQSKRPVVREILEVWNHYKDMRVRTPPDERRFLQPQPTIKWRAGSLADLHNNIGFVEPCDTVFLPWARWVPMENSDSRIKLTDMTGIVVLTIDMARNSGRLEIGRSGTKLDGPRVLLAKLAPIHAERSIYDIALRMGRMLDGSDSLDYGVRVAPNQPNPASPNAIELRVWEISAKIREEGYVPRASRVTSVRPEAESPK